MGVTRIGQAFPKSVTDHSDLTGVTSDQHHAQAHNVLSASHTDTLAASAVRGDLIIANSTPAWSRVAGVANAVLQFTTGGDTAWTTAPKLASINDTGAGAGTTRIALASSGTHLTLTGDVKFNTANTTSTTVPGVLINSVTTTGRAFQIDAASLTTGRAIQINTNALTTGRALSIANSGSVVGTTARIIDVDIATTTNANVLDDSFLDNTTEANSPGGTAFSLTVGAASYTYVGNTANFTAQILDRSTLAVYSGTPVLAVEYSSSDDIGDGTGEINGWTAVTGLTDTTNILRQDGKISWTDPGAAWITGTVSSQGLAGFTRWIRISVTGATVTTQPTAFMLSQSVTATTTRLASLRSHSLDRMVVASDGTVDVFRKLKIGQISGVDPLGGPFLGIGSDAFIYPANANTKIMEIAGKFQIDNITPVALIQGINLAMKVIIGTVTTFDIFPATMQTTSGGAVTNLNYFIAQSPAGGSLITNITGFKVENLGDTGQTLAIALDIEAQSGSTTNYSIRALGTAPSIHEPALTIGTTTAPTAKLHLGAGTTAASTAPLKLTSGSLMTTAEAGAVEFLTDIAYLTITTGAARKEITLNDAALTSGRVPFATTNGRLTSDADLTFATDTLTATKIVGTTSIKVGTAAGFISSDGSTGATGSIDTATSQIVTVKDGIITAIV